MSSSCPRPFLSIPPSCPCHCLGMSASFCMYVPFFHCQSFPYSLPSCPLVSLSFVCLSVSPHSPCFYLFPLHVPFSCPLVPFHSPCFPVMSTSCPLHVLAFSFISSPALPCIPLRSLVFFPIKNGFSKNDVKNTECFQSFSKRRQKTPN